MKRSSSCSGPSERGCWRRSSSSILRYELYVRAASRIGSVIQQDLKWCEGGSLTSSPTARISARALLRVTGPGFIR